MKLNKKQQLVCDYLTAVSICQKNLIYIADALYRAEIVKTNKLISDTMFELLLESTYCNHNKFMGYLNVNRI